MPAVVKSRTPDPEPAVESESERLMDEAREAELLVGAPKLKPYNTLRVRERKAILGVVDGVEFIDADGQLREPSMTETLDLLAQMDEALETVALDPASYAKWAVGEDLEERLTALFNRYSRQVGESTRSAN